MTPLTRVTGKLFGGSAPLNEIGQFGSAKAGTLVNTQDVATIQALSAYSNGWGSAVISNRNFPPIEEVTGVLKTLSYQNCYLLQEGIPAYDIGTEYSKTSIVKSITGTQLKFYISLTDGNVGNSLSNTTYWAEAKLNSGRNVGEYVWSSLPCTDAGLHLADGSLLTYGSYKEFIDYIASIYNSSLNYFCSEADWQASVTTYGSCGKFVYDSVNKTVRLPKVSDILTGITDVSALGDLVEAGLPNITGAFATAGNGCFGSGAFQYQYENVCDIAGQYAGHSHGTEYFNASWSNPIYGNSNTVQPQTIKALLYIVIANTTKTAIEVDIDEIATDLNGKADTDLTNTTNKLADSFLTKLVPDYSSGISLTWNSDYTTPSSGYVFCTGNSQSSNYIYLNINSQQFVVSGSTFSGVADASILMPVDKGDVVKATGGLNSQFAYFFPLKGAN